MRHILVVGGTRGIGKVIACHFAEYRLTAVGSKRPAGWLENAIRENGKLTHLIFCQRYRGDGDAFLEEIETSLVLTRGMIERCAGEFDGDNNSIVILSSIIAHTVANEQPVGYHISKAALEGMVRYYAVILGKHGIRVNGVAPGVTLKPENEAYYKAHPEKVALLARVNPLRRMGQAQDVANVVEFLCSSLAGYVTGQIITVDGGVSLVNQEALARSFLKEPVQ